MITPTASEIPGAAGELARWQDDRLPLQLHPGDLGWYSLRGLDATAHSLRFWLKDRALAAIGLLDGPDLLRIAVNPKLRDDQALAEQMAADLNSVARRIFTTGTVSVEARGARRLGLLLTESGWQEGESWTTLRRSLADPVPATSLRIDAIDASGARQWLAVHASAFRSAEADERQLDQLEESWLRMTGNPLYAQGQCLLGFDAHGQPAAVAAVWSAGPGAPGLLEPIGVHAQHRGRGYGTAISLAAAAALRSMGASSAMVGTTSANTAAIAAYVSAGFAADAPVADFTLVRSAS
ncbi:hypothetical protein AUR04nite_31340 [Glutamicibacter uratoxydans]|uniref:N-acetyltransferase domain-containing protein n=1 Tax=Glutamicibacter uratoxydans TaxID=43667 RepID=A0A4Y4DQH6_GLUUR|nr:GNAT family N-acetyltransferase [Glutamicibacter uratoxydans]GED07602.1 hypothetical protein AUR04nite_31340 [Glutamicibacter uratoxydans]